jgi:hypothetical protein
MQIRGAVELGGGQPQSGGGHLDSHSDSAALIPLEISSEFCRANILSLGTSLERSLEARLAMEI